MSQTGGSLLPEQGPVRSSGGGSRVEPLTTESRSSGRRSEDRQGNELETHNGKVLCHARTLE
jgi:hypothetical protein